MVRRLRAVLPVVLTLTLVGALVTAALPLAFDDTPDQAHLLAAARRAVEDAGSFRLAVRTLLDVDGGPEGVPFEPHRMSIVGSWSDARSYTRQAGPLGGAAEAIVDGDATYRRTLESAEDRSEQVWTLNESDVYSDDGLAHVLERRGRTVDDDRDFADQTAVEIAAWIYLGGTAASIGTMSRTTGGYIGIDASIFGGFSEAPTGFLEAIAELGEADVVYRSHGVTTLVTTLHAPDDLVEAFGHPIPKGIVRLEVGPDDLPRALRIGIEQATVRSVTDVAFTDWNEPVDIPIPAGDQVDATPWLDEEALRELSRTTLVAPTALPEGWGLSVTSTGDSGLVERGFDECDGVQLDWIEDGGGSAYFSTYLLPVDCALDEDPTPFQPGGPGGFPSRPDPDLPDEVQVLMGDTVVAVGSSFPSAEQDALIASLAPVDAEVVIAAASERPPGW